MERVWRRYSEYAGPDVAFGVGKRVSQRIAPKADDMRMFSAL